MTVLGGMQRRITMDALEALLGCGAQGRPCAPVSAADRIAAQLLPALHVVPGGKEGKDEADNGIDI